MKLKDFIIRFVLIFSVAFLINAVFSGSWNYFIRGREFNIAWEQSFRLALILAIVIPLSQALGRK
ncbi:MAG: hypothetical protein U0T82_04880 [Bacteroidales bacterium]